MKRLVFDLDGTLTLGSNGDYSSDRPDMDVIKKLRDFKSQGFEIVIYTARQMRTHQNNIGKINAHTLPTIIDWLDKHLVPYDEIFVGKPWCGNEGFYVDDKSIRPSEFKSLTLLEISKLLEKEQ